MPRPVLRPYQAAGVQALRERFRYGYQHVLYTLPTGGGKTVVFSEIASGAAEKGNTVTVLVHRQELLNQCSRNLDSVGVPHGVIAPGHTPTRHPVQVASVQTLIRRIGTLRPPDLLVIDEAHHSTAGSWRKVMDVWRGACVLGVTATPCRTDGQGLGRAYGGVYDTMVTGPTIRELIADGYLVPPIVYAPPTELDLRGVRSRAGDFDAKESAARVDKPVIVGSAVEHYRKLCDGHPAIAFCASVEHAEHVAESFRGAGYRAASIDGKLADFARKDLIDSLGTGRLHVLTSCDLISEGTDIPVVSAAILLRPTQSTGLFLQQVGRALRTAPGKHRAIILDHVGNCLRHGMPDDEREWTLAGDEEHSGGKSTTERAREVKQCPKCYGCHTPAPICPHCGHEYIVKGNAPKQVEGELREMTREEIRAAQRSRFESMQAEVRAAATREALQRIAAQRGYKPGWVEHQLREKNKKRGEILNSLRRNGGFF